MKIRIVPSSDADEQSLITYVINDSIAVDAGCLTALPIAEQRQIHSVFLSHAHMDHVASLPSFLDNVHRDDAAPVALYASVHTRDALQKHIFNDVIWPDFQRWAEPEHALVSFHDLNDQQTVSVGEEITITPLPLKHVIPTCGFLIETVDATVAIVSDTGPTPQLWQRLRGVDNLRAVFLEASFPASHQWLADQSMHLTSQTFKDAADELPGDLAIVAIHLKPAFRATILQELDAHGDQRIEVGQPGKTYEF